MTIRFTKNIGITEIVHNYIQCFEAMTIKLQVGEIEKLVTITPEEIGELVRITRRFPPSYKNLSEKIKQFLELIFATDDNKDIIGSIHGMEVKTDKSVKPGTVKFKNGSTIKL